ncbi:MAG: phage/plasmid primase, P4 family [Methanoregula sp.]|nr:phage/plasmid primase, P4 family [Methanoregula sp.]
MTDYPSPAFIPANGIARAISILAEPGQVVELRALADNAIHSGYFNNYAACARFAEVLDCDTSVHGCYVTLNVVNPALLARRANRIKMHLSRSDATTSDADIIRRRWLPIDIDPVRPSGVSSTDTEHELALAKAEEITGWLSGLGFPEPVTGDSGNGAHLLYRIDLPNDEPSTQQVKAVLAALDALFSDTGVSVDTANYNAGRIWKLYGTLAKKGDHTPERPHRRSRIISVPGSVEVVTAEQLHDLAAQLPTGSDTQASIGKENVVNLGTWLTGHGITVRSRKPYGNGGTLFTLDQCPFSSDHKDGAYAIQFASGAIHAGCHHQSCGGGKQRWKELREKYETREERVDRLSARIAGWSKERAKAKVGVENQTVPTGDAYGQDAPREYALTDAGNAERLIAQHGDSIRYCATFNSWYLWNGKVWVRDDAGRMLLIATDVARSIHREAAEAPTADRSRALSRFAILSESLHARKAMIDSAAPHIPVLPGEFDARPELFNCRNGTIGLATMSFREHRKEEMLTKQAAVDYDPAAQCPQWLAHLDLIFGSDTDYLSGFQSMCGYTLLGTNPRQVMFILYGRGRNGKSKTIEVLARIFADYAVNIAADSLMARRFENARSDLARLAGARLATAAEGAEGARMDEAIIKQITGEYVITVRKLYENEFEFTPVAKIWMTTNHEPVIPGTDDGIWRRIWMVPFSVQIPEERCDPDIAAKLLSESSGILNWCLAGLSRYYANRNRLVQPRKVLQATVNLRTVSDTVGLFLKTECTFEMGAWLSRSAFREMFEKWCAEEGIHRAPTGRRISMSLKERGVLEGGRSGNERRWLGIRWKNVDERAEFERTGTYQDVLTTAT